MGVRYMIPTRLTEGLYRVKWFSLFTSKGGFTGLTVMTIHTSSEIGVVTLIVLFTLFTQMILLKLLLILSTNLRLTCFLTGAFRRVIEYNDVILITRCLMDFKTNKSVISITE
jgi:hypothetical protein